MRSSVRHERRPSIARGSLEHSFADGLVLGYQRRLGKERTLVLINYGKSPRRIKAPMLPAAARLAPLFPASRPAGAALDLAPQSVRVFDIRR